MRALVIVDVQNDFVEGGSLAVKGGIKVAQRIGEAVQVGHFDYVVATKDWHDPDNLNGGHFHKKGEKPNYDVTWPHHCVARTHGSEFVYPINESWLDAIFLKGQGEPAFSGFQGTLKGGTPIDTLDLWLKQHNVSDVIICGLATDYCVKATAFDSFNLGYNTGVLMDLTAAVGGEEGMKATRAEFKKMGITTLDSNVAA